MQPRSIAAFLLNHSSAGASQLPWQVVVVGDGFLPVTAVPLFCSPKSGLCMSRAGLSVTESRFLYSHPSSDLDRHPTGQQIWPHQQKP